MKSRRFLLACAVCLLCAAGAASYAQGPDKAFDPSMSLEETMAWLSRQLGQQRSVAAPDGKSVWQRGTRLVKAKGCTLSYWSTTQAEGLDPVSTGYAKRELWTLDLSGLDPDSINGSASGQVWFQADGGTRNAIRTSSFTPDEKLMSVYGNRRIGNFFVRDGTEVEAVAAGLRHAVELCRQRKQ